jgi:hypothetical protein
MPNWNSIHASERIPKLPEVEADETKRALAIECGEQQAFLAARGAHAHEHALTSPSLVQPEERTPPELISQLLSSCVDRRREGARCLYFSGALKSELTEDTAIGTKYNRTLDP